MTLCSVDDCVDPCHARGLCNRHYIRWRTHGDVLYERPTREPMRRFDALTSGRIRSEVRLAGLIADSSSTQRECWPWAGQINHNGYGIFSSILAHRLVYERFVGPVPDGLELDHLCSNPPCVNPWHLEPVTHQENLLRGRGFAAANAAKTHCYRGHEYTPENTYLSAKGQRKCRACNRNRMRGERTA
jgi:hypothetical protein